MGLHIHFYEGLSVMLFANSLLAIGASPIMARTEEEVEEGSNAGRFLRLI